MDINEVETKDEGFDFDELMGDKPNGETDEGFTFEDLFK
jgi:hypothetical protein